MKVIVAQAWSVLVQFVLFGSAATQGMSAETHMLSLVPPDSEIVAGIASKPATTRARAFVLFTLANRIDYEDFLSLAAADPSLRIDQLLFTAAAGSSGQTAEHSMIVSGRVRPERIYSAVRSFSSVQEYRGIAILSVRPFERERAYIKQDRLLVTLGSGLAILGTPSTVREEIDRFLDGTEADSFIIQKVKLLNSANDDWYLFRSPARRAEFARVVMDLDPALSEVGDAEGLLFGLRFGKQVEVEYVTRADSSPGGSAELKLAARMFREDGDWSRPAMHVVRVGRARFDTWLRQAARQ